MTQTRTTALLAGLAAAAALSLSLLFAAGSAQAQTATASGDCSGVTLTPASRTVRPGGQVLLRGEACGVSTSSASAGTVQVKLQKKARWATVANVQADPSGEFSVCTRVSVPRKAKVARLRATAGGGASGATSIRISKKGSRSCSAGGGTGSTQPQPAPAPTPVTPPPAPEQGNPDCPLSQPGSDLGFTLPDSCTVVASDTASNPDPLPFWGRLDCAAASRHQVPAAGGDTSPMATGATQGNSSYRAMTVLDGDNFWGERCELGVNDKDGPVAFYREGQRRVTYASFRLPDNFDKDADKWQGVLQMKQGQSSDNGGGTPVLSLSAFEGSWSLWHSAPGYTDEDFKLWEVPSTNNVWTRFAIDAFYSQDPDKGWIKVYVDLNADGDFSDAKEQSPVMRTNTLKHEIGTDTSDGLAAGQSINSHLRVGMYHHQDIPCPASTSGCTVEADNIQVVKP
jgi:hypothetical protein